jgi:hypothetical protein
MASSELFSYVPAVATLTIDTSAATYADGDYCKLFANTGEGDAVNWTAAYDNSKFDIYNITADTLVVHAAVSTPGGWTFGFETYDGYGNAHGSGTPEEESAYIDLTPTEPEPMTGASYDNVTGILTLSL